LRLEPLSRAIDSVIDQTLDVFEIIIVDDMCDAKVKELVKSYQDSRVKYIENREMTSAASSRNIGVKNSSGDLISFLDDDDIWFKDKLERQVPLFHDHSVGLVYSPMLMYFPDLGIEYQTLPCKKSLNLSDILIENRIGGTISVIIRRDWFLSVDGFDVRYKAREEYDLWIRLIENNMYRVKYCNVLSCKVINNTDSTSRISCNIDNYVNAITLLNIKYKSIVINCLNLKELKIRRSMQFNFLASQAMKTGDRKSGIIYFFKAFQERPSIMSLLKAFVSIFGWKYMIIIRSLM
jgi:glycosyltransferase involved in cell wall biosynthesis